MKKISTCLMVLFVIGFMAGSAFAQSYCQDVLEPGNPGGRTTGLKTCDTANPVTLNPGDTFSIDIWAADIPEAIITSGFEMFYNPAQVSLVSVLAYDGIDINVPPNPWDGTATLKIPDAYGPGSYVLAVVQLGTCPVPDAGGDIIVAQVTFQCVANGTGNISVKGIDSFDTTVGCTSQVVYDATMGTNALSVTIAAAGCTGNAQCDDGIYCNGAETCNIGTGQCQAGTAVVCNDGIACTADSCNEATDSCDHIPNNAACNDGLYCSGGEVCNPASGCVAGTPVNCNDGIACTADSCNEATDSCDNIPNNAACSDGLYCNGAEVCNPASGCQAGTPVSCPSDGLYCNGTESCDEATDSCVSSGDPCTPPEVCNEDTDTCAVVGCSSDAECDDGFYCTGIETCNTGTGQCQAGTPVNCNDSVACTTDSCNEATDSCDNIPNNAACSDGLYCNGAEVCNPASGCQAGTPVSCPSDGLYCNGTESCDEATDSCVSSGDPCTPPEVCNEDTDTCAVVGCSSDAECNDGVYCNGAETCNTATGNCQAGTPVSCPSDGLYCNGTESCDEATDSCVSSGDPCTPPEVCNEDTDTCAVVGCSSDAECDDGLYCTGIETCNTGTGNCQAGTPVNCNDGIACTADSCNEATDSCDNIPNNAACSDGLYCNGAEVCNPASGCQAGMAVDCSDAVDCTDDTCDEASDICVHTPNDANCPDDGLYCNGMEVCDPINGCVSTGDPCPSGTVCNEDDDACDPVSGITVSVDIKPGSCPNPLNVKSRGVLPVAVLGSMSFNVMSIDPASIRLSRQGVMGEVSPIRWSYEDVGTPFTGELCDCHELTGDGYMDLILKFKTQELVEMLDLIDVTGTIRLTLTGNLTNGTDISGKDCIRVQGACKGDFDCDGDVDGKDAGKLKINFGWSGSADDSANVSGDFDDDGDIDATDVNGFLTIFGSKYNGTCGFVECRGDFDCDRDVDGTDSKQFKNTFGRTSLYNPCTVDSPCNGDFDADGDCDGSDASGFKSDFGRGLFQNPCRGCVET